jgi:hypothetical protein
MITFSKIELISLKNVINFNTMLSTSVKAELLRVKSAGEKLKGIKVTSDD